jgi:uncharacterized protein YkwD
VGSTQLDTTAPIAGDLAPREALMLAAINDARVEAGALPLSPRADLTAVARSRSEEMVRLDYFAHFHEGGRSAYELLDAAGITFASAGENLVKTPGDVERSVELGFAALMASSTHRDNILMPLYTQAGIGSATGEDGISIITMIFTDR